MGLRWTEEQYNEYLKKNGKVPTRRNDPSNVVLVGGYNSKWSGWTDIGGQKCYFRSKWERDFACYLEYLKKQKQLLQWTYEPRKFSFTSKYSTGATSYTPDFRTTAIDKKVTWIEVKGYLNAQSKQKIKRFHELYPEEGQIELITSAWFKQHYNLIRTLPDYISLEGLLHLKKQSQKKP